MSGVDDLVTWLRAQLDDDERVALSGNRGPWQLEVFNAIGGPAADVLMPVGDGGAQTGLTRSALLGTRDAATAGHIARWDPTRVLAEVDTKRRVLAAHQPHADGSGYIGDGRDYGSISPACTTCGTYEEYAVPWPCHTVRLLALPYADRPGYREGWRP